MIRRLLRVLIVALVMFLFQIPAWADAPKKNSRVQIIENTEKKIAIPAYSPDGEVQIQLRAVDVQLQFSAEKIGRSTIFSVYDTATGLFWWTWWYYGWKDSQSNHLSESQLTNENVPQIFTNSFSLYLSKEEIVSFSLIDPPPRIWMIASKKKYASETEAYADVFSIIDADLADIEGKGNLPVKNIEVALRNKLSQDYFCRPFNAHCEGAKIATIRHEGSDWKIDLKNYDNQPATLTLGKDFKLIGVENYKNNKEITESTP